MRLLIAVAGAVSMTLISCVVGPPAPISLPTPPSPTVRPGPWDTTYALSNQALFGPERPLGDLIAAYRLRLRDGKLRDARLLLNKAQRQLELWVGRRRIKAYRIQLGQNPTGPKLRQGDSRTPEGEYFICAHRPSTFYLALWISYPNLDDARAGLEAGRINQRQLEAIAAALKKGECPPQDTNLGGLLLLHGQLQAHTAELARDHRRRPGRLRPGLQVGDADPSKVREFYEFIPDGARLT
ncbi:MAG: hypothetical protein WBC70_07430, partial [Candidatus Aminicenantales bacterium]